MGLLDASDATLRLSVFLLAFVVLSIAERVAPRGPVHDGSNPFRRGQNLLLGALNVIVLRVAFPWLAVDASRWAAIHGWGLLNNLVLPPWFVVAVSFVLLDLLIYWQHRAMHRFPWLWRLHKVHHCDRVLDVTTAVRFHPIEILLSMGVKVVAVVALGAPVVGVIVFELLLSLGALWSHANVALSAGWDRWLRWLIVTPDMHRAHHATDLVQSNRNFGFCLALWDRWFRSYIVTPSQQLAEQALGIEPKPTRDGRLSMVTLLLLPFGRSTAG